ncbi:MAG: iron-containing alcohol dehydrogenase [Rhodobacteraceae bacterium]|nr:iron-containing alcohol dehydrogenase [Paracoccaceae bacterium]
MRGFQFQTTPSILCESGASKRIGQLASDCRCRKVALVTDRGIVEAGLERPALQGLAEAGVEAVMFDQVVADPPQAMIEAMLAKARDARIDGVVSVGGGSSLDCAKLVAVLCNSGQKLDDVYGIGMVRGGRLPLILAPTTAGTGSEVTPIAIVTTGKSEKKGVVSPQLLPDWAVLDPDLTLGLPAAVTAATGVDAMVHAIEAYTSRHRKNPLSDALAREALRLLGSNIRQAVSDPRNTEVRGAMLLGSMLAGMAFANAPVAAVHALAYPAGGHFHVPHGLSNALVLPHVLEYNMEGAAAEYAEIAPLAFADLAGLAPVKAAAGMVEKFRALGQELGMATRLREVGVSHNHLPMLAEGAMKQTRLLVNNPREMTLQAAQTIYEKAL